MNKNMLGLLTAMAFMGGGESFYSNDSSGLSDQKISRIPVGKYPTSKTNVRSFWIQGVEIKAVTKKAAIKKFNKLNQTK